MASWAARQAVRSIRSVGANHAVCSRKPFHFTPIVLKKKSSVVIEDLFGDAKPVSSIMPAPSKRQTTSVPTIPVASTSTLNDATKTRGASPQRQKLSPEIRLERFNQIRDFVSPRLGRKPAVKLPQVKKSAWVHLIGLAATEEQLGMVADMFPGWKDSGHEFGPQVSELFVRRCEELSCPLLALNVYGNYARYNLPLTLPGARQLLHSLHVDHPIDTLITASALYSIYSLPPISEDLVSCSMLVSACYKHNSKDSLRVANALTPQLEQLLKQTEPVKVSNSPTEKALDKPSVWMKWALKKVDKALFVKTGSRAEWLSRWRTKSGHILKPSSF